MTNDIRIIIADDHPIVRQGLRQVIDADPRLVVVGEAGDGLEAIELIRNLKPAVAVLDVDMPKNDGFDVAREIGRHGLDTKVVFLTIHAEPDMLQEAIDVGALGYVLKECAVVEIVTCLKTVSEGKYFVTPALSDALIDSQRRSRKDAAKSPFDGLTPTELRVVRLISEYKSNKEIADTLFIHHRTVENHRANVCQKLGLRGHHALLRYAVEHKDAL